MLQQLLVQSLESSTAHGLSRATSSKGWSVRIFWLLMFAGFATVFCINFAELVRRLKAGGTASSLASDSLDFVYPDLYFCFDNPLSGSRYLTVNKSVSDEVRGVFDRVDRVYRQQCSSSGVKPPICYLTPAHQFFRVNSLPFSLLANSLARTLEQTVLDSILLVGSAISTTEVPKNLSLFHHASHVTCFRLRLSESEQRTLRRSGPLGGVYLTLMLDSFHSRLQSHYNGSAGAMPTVWDAMSSQQPAPFWLNSLESLYVDERLPAVRLYLTPAGEYPSPFNRNFLLRAGGYHTVELDMTVENYDADHFRDRCHASTDKVLFTNPMDGSAQEFDYSFAHCYYSQLRQQTLGINNTTMGFYPEPYPPSGRPSVWHIERTNAVFQMSPEQFSNLSAFSSCAGAKACRSTVYQAYVSTLPWPPQQLYAKLQQILQQRAAAVPDAATQLPGLHFLLTQMEQNATDIKELLDNNVMKVRVMSTSQKSDEVTYSAAYTFTQFVADTGGILGVYLGMSLLTLCELLEVVYSIILLINAGPTGAKAAEPKGKKTVNAVQVAPAAEGAQFQA